MEKILDILKHYFQAIEQSLPRLTLSVGFFLLCLWLGRLTGRAAVQFLNKGNFSKIHKVFFKNFAEWLFIFLGLLPILNLFGLQKMAMSLLAGGGITAVVLGFAFREIGENLLAGFFLAFSRPFEVGDLIQSEDFQGEVHGIQLRYIHIRTEDGNDIFIPSSQIFNRPLINFTKDGLRRPSFVIGIDYGSTVKEILVNLLECFRDLPGVLKNPPPKVNIASFAAQYVELEVTFWIDTFQENTDLRAIKSAVMEKCRQYLMDNGITVSADTTSNVAVTMRQGKKEEDAISRELQ